MVRVSVPPRAARPTQRDLGWGTRHGEDGREEWTQRSSTAALDDLTLSGLARDFDCFYFNGNRKSPFA
jgi:hypothetical protein